MISFIVIGRNEGWKLANCLLSLKNAITHCNLKSYELIYIDSNSNDTSIEVAISHKPIQIYKILIGYNAAVARNLGFKQSKGNILFFIDGDMEISSQFLENNYSEEFGIQTSFLSGNWINRNFDINFNFINEANYLNINEDQWETETGGLFLISRGNWDLINGMRPFLKTGEDIDLGLRLANLNVFLLRKKEIAAIHNTVSYSDINRLWKDLLKGNQLYCRSLLYRKNIFNKYMYKRLFRHDYSLILLILCLTIILINISLFPTLLLYFLTIISRSKFNINKGLYYIARDISCLLGLILFHPKSTPYVTYEKIL
jgi:glycosyltransferase involved in cell wall biosynthesis